MRWPTTYRIDGVVFIPMADADKVVSELETRVEILEGNRASRRSVSPPKAYKKAMAIVVEEAMSHEDIDDLASKKAPAFRARALIVFTAHRYFHLQFKEIEQWIPVGKASYIFKNTEKHFHAKDLTLFIRKTLDRIRKESHG